MSTSIKKPPAVAKISSARGPLDEDLVSARSAINTLLTKIESLHEHLDAITAHLAASAPAGNLIQRWMKKVSPTIRANRRKVYEAFLDCNREVRVINFILNDLTENLNNKGYKLPRIEVAEKNYRIPISRGLLSMPDLRDHMLVPDLVPLKRKCLNYKEQIELLYEQALEKIKINQRPSQTPATQKTPASAFSARPKSTGNGR